MNSRFGKRRKNSEGYIHLYMPGVPGSSPSGWISEHRMVAALTLGRHLLPGEVVHHKNQDRADNHPENLQVFSSNSDHMAEHARMRREDKAIAQATEEVKSAFSKAMKRYDELGRKISNRHDRCRKHYSYVEKTLDYDSSFNEITPEEDAAY